MYAHMPTTNICEYAAGRRVSVDSSSKVKTSIHMIARVRKPDHYTATALLSYLTFCATYASSIKCNGFANATYAYTVIKIQSLKK